MSVRILQGDCREVLRTLPADSVDCVVTSPPYWGLRDYGVEGQLGLERSLGEHIDTMVDVFREVRRVLKPTGTFWLNYGDCYATSPNGRSAADTKAVGNDDRTFRDKPFSTIGGVLKAKDLCMVPNRMAIALQEDGWWVRSEIIWAKPNPMPESIKDRPGTAHEKIFMLSKSARYFYDYDAVRQPMAKASIERLGQNVEDQAGSSRANGGVRADRPMKALKPAVFGGANKADGYGTRRHSGNEWSQDASKGRNLRNYEPAPVEVWRIATKPFKEAHFATFPPELARRCILAGCPPCGVVLDPFFGAGTVGLVANELGRDCIGIELSADYIDITKRRLMLA